MNVTTFAGNKIGKFFLQIEEIKKIKRKYSLKFLFDTVHWHSEEEMKKVRAIQIKVAKYLETWHNVLTRHSEQQLFHKDTTMQINGPEEFTCEYLYP